LSLFPFIFFCATVPDCQLGNFHLVTLLSSVTGLPPLTKRPSRREKWGFMGHNGYFKEFPLLFNLGLKVRVIAYCKIQFIWENIEVGYKGAYDQISLDYSWLGHLFFIFLQQKDEIQNFYNFLAGRIFHFYAMLDVSCLKVLMNTLHCEISGYSAVVCILVRMKSFPRF
jgi:hypothetical protein